jgi:hypothetical protein
MSSLPDQQTLVRHVCDALHETAASVSGDRHEPSDGWTNCIGKAISDRLDSEEQGIECAFGGRDAFGRTKPEWVREWIFDFSAVLVEPKNRNQERYAMQPLVIGEVEWQNNLGRDFEKLLVVDALVCFFAFPKRLGIKEHNSEYFLALAKKRRQYVAKRGTAPLPVFIIACYDSESRSFDVGIAE